MKTFDLHRMALDKVPMDFLGKLRYAASTPLYWFFCFKNHRTSRRTPDVAFEVLIILTLGSAAGDVAFYDDVPMLPVLVVLLLLLCCIGW